MVTRLIVLQNILNHMMYTWNWYCMSITLQLKKSYMCIGKARIKWHCVHWLQNALEWWIIHFCVSAIHGICDLQFLCSEEQKVHTFHWIFTIKTCDEGYAPSMLVNVEKITSIYISWIHIPRLKYWWCIPAQMAWMGKGYQFLAESLCGLRE